jgi:hypothetical protein
MKKKITIILLPLLILGFMMFQGGCVKENFDTIPNIKDTSNLVVTASIAEVKALLTNITLISKVKGIATPTFWQTVKARNLEKNVSDTASIVIEGYVTSSDSTGNFYKVFTIQDATGGIDIEVNNYDLYTTYRFKPGQKVLVKVNDLYLGFYRGIYQLGAAIVELGALKIVGIPPAQVSNFIQRTGYRKKLIPDTLTIDQINGSYVQKYVCIKNVQFKDPFNGFSILGVNTNRTLMDCAGNMLILRTSGFATFAQTQVPSGNGTITGVLSTYDATRQLYIRDLNDIKFTNARCGSAAPTPNTTIAELKAMCVSSYFNITTDIVISGVISGNDESGNLYKQLNIQDETGGITFSINMGGLYPEYPIGNRIVVNCNGLCIGKYGGIVQLGMPPFTTYVTRVEPSVFYSKVFTVESGVSITPIVTTIDAITNDMVNKLVTIKDVQFSDGDQGKSWSEPSATTNRNLENIVGNRLIVRTSNFASFALSTLPSGSGNITAILTKYNSDFQLAVRNLSDIRQIKPRFLFLLSEGFSAATVSSPISVNGWKTVAVAGTKTWLAKVYSGDTYAEMNPYNSGEASNISWLVSPQVNLAGITNPTLIFQTEYNYWNSIATLQAFISTDFNGTDVTTATWTPLSTARLVVQADGINKWVNSGLIDLSQYTGNVYIGFKYTNSGGTSATAFRVDNVKIFSNK